jgi:plasmid stabilization system protein ParE
MARVVFTQTAKQHLREISEYIARDSPSAAKAIVRPLRSEAGRLARYPEMGRIVPEYDDPSIRELIVSPYRLM